MAFIMPINYPTDKLAKQSMCMWVFIIRTVCNHRGLEATYLPLGEDYQVNYDLALKQNITQL